MIVIDKDDNPVIDTNSPPELEATTCASNVYALALAFVAGKADP
jgi:hypothetical protein